MTGSGRAIMQACHSFLNGLAYGASFAPIPGLPIVLQLLDQILRCAENVKVNKDAVKSLRKHCEKLRSLLYKVDKSKESEDMHKVLNDLTKLLIQIQTKMELWSSYGTMKSFFLQSEIMGDISHCSLELDKHIKYFELICQMEIKSGVSRLEELVKDIVANQHIAFDLQRKDESEMQKLQDDMVNLQSLMKGTTFHSGVHNLIARDLYNITKKNNLMLPEDTLEAGEVKRLGTQPVGGSAEYDVWKGLYLDNEECMLKVIRAANFGEKQKMRLLREIKIWRKLWEIDQGVYVVRFYGVCFIDGPYPYIVHPYFRNGDALTYVRTHPDVDRLAIIRRVAEGLRLLHNQNPPIVHGELKASKIMINDEGLPLIADFGFSKMIENATSVPFTHTLVFTAQYRWFAPEVCSDTYTVSTASDVFSFAMTILEIMTGKEPFYYVKRQPEVLMRIQQGQRPERPTDPEVIERGLDDKLWDLLQRCWLREPEERPSIEQILQELPMRSP